MSKNNKIAFAAAVKELLKEHAGGDLSAQNEFMNAAMTENWNRAPWSNINPRGQDTAQANGGVGVALYYRGQHEGDEFSMILVQPNLKNADTSKVQIAGGFIDFTKGESKIDAVKRELSEEILNADGKPVLTDFDEDRLVHLDDMIIYPNDEARYVDGYVYELTDDEFSTLQGVITNGIDSEAYKKHTNGELIGFTVVPSHTVFDSPDVLNHQDQLSLMEKLRNHVIEENVVSEFGEKLSGLSDGVAEASDIAKAALAKTEEALAKRSIPKPD